MRKLIELDELKKIELDILRNFAEFCNEHNLRYYLAYGTLLGAVKYCGFIPWDDDIDVLMPRPDYIKFLQISKGKITDDIDILTFQNTPGYIYPFAKAVNNKTVMIEDLLGESHVLGVYMDIFPIDGIGNKNRELKILTIKRALYRKLLGWSVYRITKGNSFVKMFLKSLIYPIFRIIGYRFFIKRLDKLSQKQNYDETYYVAQVVWDKDLIPILKDEYIKPIELEFEGFKFNAPSNYHEHLFSIYGDYRKSPPESKCITHHHFQAYWKQ